MKSKLIALYHCLCHILDPKMSYEYDEIAGWEWVHTSNQEA